MREDILNTMFYLIVVLWGIPTIYFGTTTLPIEEIKRKAIKVYPSLLFLVLLITVLIFGVSNTKRAISYVFGEVIFFIFFFIIIAIVFLSLFYLFFGGWRVLLDAIKDRLRKKK